MLIRRQTEREIVVCRNARTELVNAQHKGKSLKITSNLNLKFLKIMYFFAFEFYEK
jgi:hypothetical protein